jgi:hypothetical protein
MPNEPRSVDLKKLVKPISDTKAADLVRKIQTAIKIHNELSSGILSNEQFVREMGKVQRLVIPTAAEIVLPFTWLVAGRQMAIAGTGGSQISLEEVLATLREPERHRSFYPETMRAGARAMIRQTHPFWPNNLADILEASLSDLDDGQTSKMLTPEPRKIRKGSLPDRKRFTLCLASEVEFQKSTYGVSDHRAVHMVTGQTRDGFDAESLALPPPIPLPWMSWENIMNSKDGILAFARKRFPEAIADAAAAGQLNAAGDKGAYQKTDFASFRSLYLRPEAWAAIWARATGRDPKTLLRKVRIWKSRKA